MRAIHINSITREISTLDLADGTFKSIRAAIPSQWIERVPFLKGHYLWVDEEGLINGRWTTFFQPSTYGKPIAGNAVVLLVSQGEDERACELSLDEVIAAVSFPAVRFTGIRQTVEQRPGFVLMRNIAEFEPE